MSRQFIIIPFRALDMDIDGKYIKTLCVLGGHTNKHGECKIRQNTIAEILGVSRKTVNEHMKVLASHGLIEKQSTKRADGGNGAIVYRMINDTPPVTPRGYTPCNPQEVTPPVTTAVTANVLTMLSNEEKYIKGFEFVWSTYNPHLLKSRQGGKQKALKAFIRQAKTYGVEELLFGLNGYYTDKENTKNAYQFAAAIVSCLNQEKFAGYLKSAQSAPASNYAASRMAAHNQDMETAQ